MTPTLPPTSSPTPGTDAALYGPPGAVPEGAFPQDGPPADQLRFLLAYAVLAPSLFNSQPWRFELEGAEVRLYADQTRRLPALDPDGRELVISCGAALLNLRIAARHVGSVPVVDVLPDPADADLLARLRLGRPEPATREDDLLFRALRHRHTVRDAFADTALPGPLLDGLAAAATREGARLTVFAEQDERATVAALLAEGIRAQGASRAVADDVQRWLRASDDPRRDGVPDSAQGTWDRLSGQGVLAEDLARRTAALVTRGPTVVVLSTGRDDPAAWLAAGQALERVLLTAAAQGVQASYHNALVEVAPLRERLAHVTGAPFAQVVLRLGYPVEEAGVPRRSVYDVVR